ncbi:para-aminobenzoate synthase component I [Escherichia coli]|nr:para-aminobenzoate synthase component I [Escherichia coli]
MKTLSPAVITLPWRQDAAEFYFSRLSHLPWAMLLHSGYADHPYSRFDIVVAEPICTLTTFGKETVVSESEKRTTTTDDPLQVLQQVLDRADIRPTHNEDLPFQGGALGCLATIWAAVLSHCQKLRNKISFCRIWQWVSTIGRSLSTTSVIQFLC